MSSTNTRNLRIQIGAESTRGSTNYDRDRATLAERLEHMKRNLRDFAAEVHSQAQVQTPVDTGELRRSVYRGDVPYARYVQWSDENTIDAEFTVLEKPA